MFTTPDSPLAIALMSLVPDRLKEHSYSILELAQEMAQEFNCPLCEILTPMGEAMEALVVEHQIKFDPGHKQVMLA